MNISEANDTFTVLAWIGVRTVQHDVTDAEVLDALVQLARRAAKELHTPIPADSVALAFEAMCIELRGTAEAEQVCEALEHHWGINANHSTAVALADALDRWRATRRLVR